MNVDLSYLRYAQVWEDVDVLRRGLAIESGARVFSIGAAGDNALALLLDDPAEVVAVDLNPAQLALFELKVSALKHLSHDELLAFMGLGGSEAQRERIFLELRPELSAPTRAFFDAHVSDLRAGVIHRGKFERYFALFRRWVLPLVQSRRSVRRCLAVKDLEEQRSLFASTWDNRRWRFLFRVFFGQVLLGRLGRDHRLFSKLGDLDVAETLLQRVNRSIEGQPIRDNYFLEYILTGSYSGRHGLPAWLLPENHRAIVDRLDRLRCVEGAASEVLAREGSFSAFNFSDLFEWMDADANAQSYAAMAKAATPGARVVSWDLFAPRDLSLGQAEGFEFRETLSRELSAVDRGFFYDGVVVQEMAA